jgi:dihydroorotate dehydrogenase
MSDEFLLPGATSNRMNAAGFLGYLPPASSILSDKAGCFVTPAISWYARKPVPDRCLVEYPGGFLLHTGSPNDGFIKTIKHFASKWGRLKMPVWPHLLPKSGYECRQMVQVLENLDNIGAIEIGLPGNAESSLVEEILQASLGELPIYVSVPFLSPWENWLDLLRMYTVAGIVLSAPRGCLVNNAMMTNGRLYGPALLPQLLEKFLTVKDCGIPLIAGSGIFSFENADNALQAGASGVQLDAWLWQLTPPTSPSRS